eukprot:scaffold4464_cov87-Skeletonema_marinoi.AAC.2
MSRKRSHTLTLTQSKLELLYHEQQIQQKKKNKKKSGVLNWMKLRKKGKNLTDEPVAVENGVIFVDDDDDGDHVDLEAFKKAFVEVNGDTAVADANANTQAVGEGAVDEGACVVKSVEAADKASVTRLFQDAISLPSSLTYIKEKFSCGTCTGCKIEITDVELPFDGGGRVSVMTEAVDEGACVVKSVEAADKASVTRLFQDAISLPSSLTYIKEKFSCGTCTGCKIEITDVELPFDGGGSVSVMTDGSLIQNDATAEKINAADEKTEEKGVDGGASVGVSKEGSLVKEDATAENEESEKEGVEKGSSASVGISKKGSLIQDDATAETEKSSAADEESEEEGVEVDINSFGNVKTENVKTLRRARKFGRVLSVHREK